MSEKTCTKCGETKPLETFRVDRSKRSGHKQPCQDCNVRLVCAWQKGDTPKARAWRQQSRARTVKAGRALRQQILLIYGSRCACCGESTPEFLTIDHIKNDGAAHRKEVGEGGRFYKWLRRQGFPKDNFQLLCFNCNCAKGIHGECPHKKALNKAA